MSSTTRIRIDEHHRVEVSIDSRDGSVHVGLRRHRRGRPSWFSVAEWRVFIDALEAVDVDKLIAAALARQKP